MTFLLDSWKTESWQSYSLTLLFCFLLSFFHQRLEAQRFRLNSLKSTAPPSRGGSAINSNASTPLIYRKLGQTQRWIRIASAVLFGITSAIGYVIMLAIMSYNGGVFVAVVLGLSIGYFCFRSDDLVDDEDVQVLAEETEPAHS